MVELTGDIWSIKPVDAICITTNAIVKDNGCAVMEAGISKQARDKFKGIDLDLGFILDSFGHHVDVIWCTENFDVLCFPTKYHYKDSSLIGLIERSCEELTELADRMKYQNVLLPRPGCKNGGLSWEHQVRPIVQKILDSNIYKVVTYDT